MLSFKLIVGFLIIILFFHLLAMANFWYWRFQWIDIPMHFFGGFWIAMVFFWFYPEFKFRVEPEFKFSAEPEFKTKKNNFLTVLIFCLGFVALNGVLWEFFEFGYDWSFLTMGQYVAQAGIADTMADLFFDLLGGFVLVHLVYYGFFSRANQRKT